MAVIESQDNIGSDPSLRPLTAGQVGDPIGVTLKAKADSPTGDSEPDPAIGEPEPTHPLDDPAEGLLAAGFKLVHGVWVR